MEWHRSLDMNNPALELGDGARKEDTNRVVVSSCQIGLHWHCMCSQGDSPHPLSCMQGVGNQLQVSAQQLRTESNLHRVYT